MKAKITHKDGYNAAPLGHTVEHYPFGAAVEGQVAKWALADGKASADFDPRSETKVFAPTETKVAPLTGGKVNKGGHNVFPSQVTERPPAPTPMKRKDRK
tara:strand:+ start:121 stop:420 length:300 start_codon:yes stop_codon:yes gene_type:complete